LSPPDIYLNCEKPELPPQSDELNGNTAAEYILKIYDKYLDCYDKSENIKKWLKKRTKELDKNE
jgi:transposase